MTAVKPTLVVKTVDLKRFQHQLQQLSEAAQREALVKAATVGSLVVETHTKMNILANFTMRTGTLLNNWSRGILRSERTRAEVFFGTNTVYARIHEFGGVIRPLTARALAFETADGGFHIVQQVTIPARPYVRPAMDNNHEEIMTAIINEVKQRIRGRVPGSVR